MKTPSLVLGCLLAGCLCAAGAHTLTIDGARVDKTVATITFDGDKAILTFGDNSTSTHDLGSLVLDFNSTSGISDIRVGQLSVTVGESITVSGLSEGTPVIIYNVRGEQLKAFTASGSAECVIALDGVPGGVYILSAGSEIVKFVKR